ncbi:M20/M25/M40 family metallo-hydrolase [Candidatus Bathyarchaeota archaeon]|nr:M20/M25/M40 family metallo-hydrolase [Candidatus Bathyarchaeota archaeon]
MDAVSLLEALTRIESCSGKEERIASFILNHLRNMGYYAFIEDSNVLLQPEKDLIVATHIDTFKVLSPYSFDGKYAYGTGVCDAKASITSILLALEKIGPNRLRFGVAFFHDEEGEGKGSMDFCRTYKPKMAIVMEPTDMAIANVQYGGLEVIIKARGIAAHGATPHMGKNAIEKCIEAISVLMRISEATASVQYISGGNIEDFAIPSECEARIEFFFRPDIKAEHILAKIKESLCPKNFEITIKEAYDGFVSVKASKILENAIKVAGYSVRFSEMPSWTDAVNLYKCVRCDSVIFGPGELHLCHTKNERVRVKDVITAADILVALNSML